MGGGACATAELSFSAPNAVLNDVTVHPEGRPSSPPPSPEETVTLLARVRAGDDDALQALLIRLLPRLRRWAHGRLPPAARGTFETADAVQAVTAKAVRRLASDRVARSTVVGYYLRQAMAAEIASEWSKAVRTASARSSAEPLPGGDSSPLERLIGAERLQRYEAALQRLPPDERETIVGRFELAYGYDDLARYLGLPSADTARVAVQRAVKHLIEAARHV